MKVNIPKILQARPRLEDLGPVPDPASFSMPCAALEAIPGLDLKGHTDDQDMPDIPAQFHAAVRMAVASHNRDFGPSKTFALHLNQGPLKPKSNFRVIAPHVDPIVRRYPENESFETDAYIVSDRLTTVFYDQAFDVPDDPFCFEQDIHWKLCDLFAEQAKPDARIIPEPYHLIRFSPYAVHEAQLSAVPVQRTFMLLRFFE